MTSQIERSIADIEDRDSDNHEGEDYRTPDFEVTQSDSAHLYLPHLVLASIIRVTVRRYPFMTFTFREVSRFFRNTVESIGYPSIYLNPDMFGRNEGY